MPHKTKQRTKKRSEWYAVYTADGRLEWLGGARSADDAKRKHLAEIGAGPEWLPGLRAQKKSAEDAYKALFDDDAFKAGEYESETLGIGDEFLPDHVRRVKVGRTAPTDAYWEFLIEQIQNA